MSKINILYMCEYKTPCGKDASGCGMWAADDSQSLRDISKDIAKRKYPIQARHRVNMRFTFPNMKHSTVISVGG